VHVSHDEFIGLRHAGNLIMLVVVLEIGFAVVVRFLEERFYFVLAQVLLQIADAVRVAVDDESVNGVAHG